MRKPLAYSAAAALALGGCSALGIPEPMAPMAADMTPEDRAGYVMMAGASDLYEIRSSQLARTRARSAAVRQFADMMISHHSGTTNQLMAAVRASGMNPPAPMLMPMQAQMMAQLQQSSAGNFDRVYMSQQVRAHEMALALHSNYARSGDTAALRVTAGAAVPIVSQHLQRARQLD